METRTELDLVLQTLEALADEQAGNGFLRWSGMTLMARQTIRALAKTVADLKAPPAEEPPGED